MDQSLHGRSDTEVPAAMSAREAVPATAEPADGQAKELALRIKRLIRRRTGGGIDQLRVDVTPDTILLSGRCTTFYCKQLAQQAAMLLRGPRRIDDRVVVTYIS